MYFLCTATNWCGYRLDNGGSQVNSGELVGGLTD